MELTSCTSAADKKACQVQHGARMTAENVSVTKSESSGFCARTSGELVLRECMADTCKEHGVHETRKAQGWMQRAARCSRKVSMLPVIL